MKTLSRQKRIEQAVLEIGPCRVADVLTVVGEHISAAEAVTAGRRQLARDQRRHKAKAIYTLTETIVLGKKQLVRECLKRAVYKGCLRRVRVGVYAPPLPKLFAQPETQSA